MPHTDQELRLIALSAAIEIEGEKAVTNEVLGCAEAIYDFLRGVESIGEGKPN